MDQQGFEKSLREDYEEMKIQMKRSMKMEFKGSRCRSALKRSEDVDTKKCSKWNEELEVKNLRRDFDPMFRAK